MSELEAYKALSNKARMDMLRLLHRKHMGAEDLARQLDIQPVTVRHHLRTLEQGGLVERQEVRSGAAGRPKMVYAVVRRRVVPGFPRRQYLTLSNYVIGGLLAILGKDKTKALLRKVGLEMGESTAKKLTSDCNVKEWTPESFRSFFVDGYLAQVGAEPEVIEIDDKQVLYRLHNCIFFELALEKPDVVCDVLHDSFHDGLARKMGKGCKIQKTKCMIQGDPYCEHRYSLR